MRTLSYGMWDLDPWPGIEPQSLLWAREVLATGLPRKPLPFFLLSLQFLNLWTDSAFLGKHFLSPQNLLCNCCSTQSLALSDSLSEENAFKHALWFSFCLCITLMHHWLYIGQIVHMAAFPCLALTTLVLFLQFSSVQSLSRVRFFATPWIAARQASLSNTNSQSLFKLMPIESMMPSSHLMLCRPFLLLPPIPPSIRVFSNESTLHMRWPKYWSFSFSISPPSEHPGLISFRMDLFTVQGLSRVISDTYCLQSTS